MKGKGGEKKYSGMMVEKTFLGGGATLRKIFFEGGVWIFSTSWVEAKKNSENTNLPSLRKSFPSLPSPHPGRKYSSIFWLNQQNAFHYVQE